MSDLVGNPKTGFLTTRLISYIVVTRAATIRLSHDTIRIAIQSSQYDTYRDTFQKSQTKCPWCINTHINMQCVKRLHNILLLKLLLVFIHIHHLSKAITCAIIFMISDQGHIFCCFTLDCTTSPLIFIMCLTDVCLM